MGGQARGLDGQSLAVLHGVVGSLVAVGVLVLVCLSECLQL